MSSYKRLCYNNSMRKNRREGFTLVELSLSLVFVGILSIAMTLMIINAVSSYRRGNTLGQVNLVGIDLVDDMRATVQSSSAKTLAGACATVYANNKTASEENGERDKCMADDAYNFVTVVKKSTVTLYANNESKKEVITDIPIYGVFCTGTYSYIWNSGYFYMDEASFEEKTRGEWAKLKTHGGYVNDGGLFKLMKVRDDTKAIRIAAVHNRYEGLNDDSNRIYDTDGAKFVSNEIDVSQINGGVLEEDPIFLLASSETNKLALYDLAVARPAVSTENNSVFYAVSFILGTVEGGINITSSGSSCKAPNDYESNLDYCAINEFSFAARATGE